jgi:two-component system, chemotaxis family, sensor kinase CheA
MIDQSMLPDFIIEAAEHLEELENSLLRIEQSSADKEVLDEIFRSIHTIKGAAQFVGVDRVAELSHKLENLLDLIRRGKQALTPSIVDLLIEGKDRITQLVDEVEQTQGEKTPVDDLLVRIKKIVEGEAEAEAPQTVETVEDQYSEEPRPGLLAEENINEEYDEELYNIFLQQLKENIPFLYAQTVELSLSVDKQDVLDRCNDSIKSLKSSANYMGYEKLARHYSDWQRDIKQAVDQLSSGKMPNLAFMQDYIDEIIRSFPQAMDGYSQDEVNELHGPSAAERKSVENALDSIFSLEDDEDDDPQESTPRGLELDRDMDMALDSIFDNEPIAAIHDALDAEEPEPVSSRTSRVVVVPPALEYELSEDEYDRELVEIFVRKLKTDIQFIQEQAQSLDEGAEAQGVLERCQDAVVRLASSANYMEYLSLSAYCEQWEQALHNDIVHLSQEGTPGDAGRHLHAFWDALVEVYPNLVEGRSEVQVSVPSVSRLDDTFDDASETVESLLSVRETSPEPEPESKISKQLVAAVELEAAPEAAEGDDQELFAKLSKALDLTLSHDEVYTEEDEHVIEAIMEPDATPLAPSVPPAPQASARSLEKKSEPKAAEAQPKPKEEKKEEKKQPSKVAVTPIKEKLLEDEPLSFVPDIEKFAKTAPAQEAEQSDDDSGDDEEKSAVKRPASRTSIRVDSEKIDYLMNQVGELVVSRAYFAQLVNEMRSLQQHLQEQYKLTKTELKPLHEFSFRLSEAGVHLGRVSNELQEGVMKVRMLPIDQLFKRYPRLVRDLVHRSSKDVRLVTKGEDTELDKMVIESISDPMIHIIRNAVDHGIETVEERKSRGKPGQATLFLEAYHESDHIVLEVSDDGRGIDPQRIKAKALERKLFSADELARMSEIEILRIIMLPGFSTAEKATETSGRGVGMDVVRKNIERLNGIIEIISKVGQGTRFRIKIPLTMAIIQALMVRVGREKFTIPLTSVEETLRIFRQQISEIEGVDVIHIRDITMPIFSLAKIYNIPRETDDEDKMFVVVVSTGSQEVGLVVDELLGQEEVVIKPLADYLRMESGFGGATILGDGGISLILDIAELVKMATENQVDRQQERSLTYRRKRKRSVALAEGEQRQHVH